MPQPPAPFTIEDIQLAVMTVLSTFPEDHTYRFFCDGVQRCLEITDPAGRVRTFRLLSTNVPIGFVTTENLH